ncbi:ABC transporter substrate-binding protein [Blastococcus xanthinilyticus]|uniref:ABC-type branched-subunit amino acid transport system substrate-binding protein n=1 Tax=Blastococcus xanthinilyticus TaxID=1564164 RepID=A0A5S5CY42_9ACTN|nr:ABC transporter substrate-binding protein [Blastococcus xanthinilyticus]TYP87948.1 ABC-type branched-subunit amino acid transport system substrate-binding protein [Blastococcus xanthinilyticus]
MTISTRSGTATLLAAAVVVAAGGCSTKAPGGDSGAAGGGGGDVATDIGVDGETITLGVLTDLTGVFAASGNDQTNGHTMFWKTNQVCDTYDVELEVQDTGYVPQQGVQLYSAMEGDVLAMQQTIGSPINTALAPDYEADSIVNIPSAWAETLTQIPGTGVPGATYQVELSNGYDYMFDQGLLQEGDTVGHIYFEGEFGSSGLAGTEAVAAKKDLEVIPAQIKATDQDMSAQITQFKAAGVDLIALTVAPGQLASAAVAMEAQGLDVPILGSNPVFAPGLLDGPAAEKIKQDLYFATPVSAFDQHPELLEQYAADYEGTSPSLQVLVGYGMAAIMKQVLDQACENGDLTREGVLSAFDELEEVDSGGVVVPIRGFELGTSPSLESFILQPADVPGGAKVLQEAFEGEFAADIAG